MSQHRRLDVRKYQGVLVSCWSEYWRDRLPLVNVSNYRFSTAISDAAASLVVLKEMMTFSISCTL